MGMKWPVSFAKTLLRRSGIGNPDPIRSRKSADTYGPASIIETTQRPDLPLPLEQTLHQRAIRVCNREPKAIARYMQTNLNLSRGR